MPTVDQNTLAYYTSLAETKGVRAVVLHLLTVIAEQGEAVVMAKKGEVEE